MNNVKDEFLNFGNFILQSGNQIRFWEDIWLDPNTLREQYPNLYYIVHEKDDTIANALSIVPLNISFRRSLVDANLVMRIAQVHLNDQPNIFRWSLKSDGQFSVSSMYSALLDTRIVPHNIYLWKLKIPLKIKAFLWLLYKKNIFAKDNLVKRNWHGNEKCCFCDNYETTQHQFFYCDLTMLIWRVMDLAFGLIPHVSINHMFGTWVLNIQGGMWKLLLVRIGVILWVVWLS
jgi:hypothetical protein